MWSIPLSHCQIHHWEKKIKYKSPEKFDFKLINNTLEKGNKDLKGAHKIAARPQHDIQQSLLLEISNIYKWSPSSSSSTSSSSSFKMHLLIHSPLSCQSWQTLAPNDWCPCGYFMHSVLGFYGQILACVYSMKCETFTFLLLSYAAALHCCTLHRWEKIHHKKYFWNILKCIWYERKLNEICFCCCCWSISNSNSIFYQIKFYFVCFILILQFFFC